MLVARSASFVQLAPPWRRLHDGLCRHASAVVRSETSVSSLVVTFSPDITMLVLQWLEPC